MIQVVEHFLGAFVAILPMVNPLSTMVLFLSLTSGMSAPKQRYQALKASIIAAVIMLVVLYIGATVLHFFGISIGALRVTGGLIVAYIGLGILFPNATPTPGIAPDSNKDDSDLDFAFMPLAFPSLVGPGAMAVVMSMTTHAGALPDITHRLLSYAAVSLSILLVALVTWLVLRTSTKLLHLLGPRGLDAMTRIMGLLLMCIGVQFVATGIRNFVSE
ncbi:MAG: MarC family NAAT transporter [Gammaproteobacteria bacterium]